MGNYENCWLNYYNVNSSCLCEKNICTVYTNVKGKCIDNAVSEIFKGMAGMFGLSLDQRTDVQVSNCSDGILLKLFDKDDENDAGDFVPDNEGYAVYFDENKNILIVSSASERGILYGVFELLRQLQCGSKITELSLFKNPSIPVRMLDHWDNMYGDIERGYSGDSFFYKEYNIIVDDRITAYARLMASIGINAITINNVNVHQVESYLITDRFLPQVKQINDIFNSYGIKLYLSVNFAAPMELGDTDVCDPCDASVIKWWERTVDHLYEVIPDFGGFLVKADSEGRPGPFTYGRNHADGANMLAKAVGKYGGNVVWRCFVYNCKQDWRDRKTDRARAAYDNFASLDGLFDYNVVLQIKNGPVDFQVREPVSPLFGAMKKTNVFAEFQIAQEYTGQQRHICYLIPMWKEILDFNTYACERGTVKDIVSGKAYGNSLCGIAGVTNTGNDENWTGHDFAAANLFGYGLLCFDPEMSAEEIGKTWAACTFGNADNLCCTVYDILAESWHTYEKYTAPLGIGWMVNPSNHYGPNVDGYEYDVWGTYHRADRDGLGVERSLAGGTGFAAQYNSPWKERYECIETTPEELLLFFHYVRYDYVLSSGKTLIQHIYDTHFEGVDEVREMIIKWNSLKSLISSKVFNRVSERLDVQLNSAIEWRDRINTYFYRMSGVSDVKGRTIY